MRKLRAPKGTSKTFYRPSNATCFQIERSPRSFLVEGSAAETGDEPHGAVELLLLKCSAKAIDAGVAVHRERAGVVVHGDPIGEDQDRWSGEVCEQVTQQWLPWPA